MNFDSNVSVKYCWSCCILSLNGRIGIQRRWMIKWAKNDNCVYGINYKIYKSPADRIGLFFMTNLVSAINFRCFHFAFIHLRCVQDFFVLFRGAVAVYYKEIWVWIYPVSILCSFFRISAFNEFNFYRFIHFDFDVNLDKFCALSSFSVISFIFFLPSFWINFIYVF